MWHARIPGNALVLVLLIFSMSLPVQGQQNSFAAQVRRAYGPSQKLVNGIQYYDRHTLVQNHPYFMDRAFVTGAVTIDGKDFPDVRIRYNLQTQRLELEYETFTGAINTLEMVSEHVDAFVLGGQRFERQDLDDGPLFYQVVQTEAFTCYVYRAMELMLVDQGFFYDETYKGLDSRFLIRLDGETHDFSNKKSFAACFPENRQKEIRRFLRQKQFVFRNASAESFGRRMHEISDLLGNRMTP